jgi:hypothetical protein
MIPVIKQTEKEIIGRNSIGETIRVATEGDNCVIYHSDIGPEPCRLMSLTGVFVVLNHRGRPQVIDQDEMLFILWAIDKLGQKHKPLAGIR